MIIMIYRNINKDNNLKEKKFKRLSYYHDGNLATAPVLGLPRLPAHPRRKQVQVESQIISS